MHKSNNRARLIVLLLLGLLLCITARAADMVVDVSRLEQDSVSLTEYFAVLEDPGQILTLADVQKAGMANRFKTGQAPAEALSFGVTPSVYWLRLSLRNSSGLPVQQMLELSYAVLSQVEFHQPLAGGASQSVVTGAATAFSTRAYPNRFFVFPITLPAHTDQVVFLRIRTTSSMLVPARLWMPAAFHAHERDDYALQAWYFGMVSAMVLFNFLLFVALKDSVYLLYIAFVVSTALSISSASGLGKEFLWPETTRWSDMSASICYVYMEVSLLLLMRRMLNTKEIVPRLDWLVKVLACLNLLQPIAIAASLQMFAFPVRLFFIMTGLLTLFTGIYCAVIKRQRIAAIFVVAFLMFILGPYIIGMKLLKVLPVNFLTTNALIIGSALEMILMAFALAYRFNMIRRQATLDVEQANAGLGARLRERDAELTASHLQLREIEHRQTLSEERRRLMQDMHDGLGSSLTTALRVVEHGRLDDAEVAQVLKGCIDDLKLAIDSMEPVQADLLLLLATLRFRLGPRLESTGITLRWEVNDIPMLDWLEPGISLHILRILQEAFTNIIKHANATEIRVTTGVDGNEVLVMIADNGRGFSTQQAPGHIGKGLSNQVRRAQSIGGRITWESGDAGTCVTLRLPVERP